MNDKSNGGVCEPCKVLLNDLIVSQFKEEPADSLEMKLVEEEEEDEEDEDRLDVVGLDECSSSRPGRPFVFQFVSLSFLMCPHPSKIQYQGVHVSMRCPRSGIVVSIRLLELISKIRNRGRFHQQRL